MYILHYWVFFLKLKSYFTEMEDLVSQTCLTITFFSVETSKGQFWIGIDTKIIKKRFAIFINIEPLKKASKLQRLDISTELGKKKIYIYIYIYTTTYCFIFITSFSFGFLGGWVFPNVVDTWTLSLGSSFESVARVASTSSML